jgi:hypothetical protein
MSQSTILFCVFVGIFALTALITLLGVCDILKIKEGYLKVLVSALIIELIGSVMGLFKTIFITQNVQMWEVIGQAAFGGDGPYPDKSTILVSAVPTEINCAPDGRFAIQVLAKKNLDRFEFPDIRLRYAQKGIYGELQIPLDQERWKNVNKPEYTVKETGAGSFAIEKTILLPKDKTSYKSNLTNSVTMQPAGSGTLSDEKP